VELAFALRLFNGNPLEEACEKIVKIGFKGVELDWETLSRQLAADNHWYATLGRLLERLELKASSVRIANFTAEREDQQTLQVHVVSQLFNPIRELGCKRIVLSGGPRTLENFNCFRDGLLALAEKAQPLGLEIVVSNEIDTRLENLQDFQALFAMKFPDNVGVCVDVRHCHLAAVNPGDLIREQNPRIKLLRLCDMMGNLSVMPGQGEIEIKGIIRDLRKADYDDMVVLDYLPLHDTKIEREIQQAYRYLQTIVI
jgi:sugar phosphate isomerase/epimerase